MKIHKNSRDDFENQYEEFRVQVEKYEEELDDLIK
jgi:hypothetical protein